MRFKRKPGNFRIMYIIICIIIAVIIAGFCYMNHPKFGYTPSGERLEKIQKSPNYRDGAFQNQYPTPQITSDKSRIKVMFDFLFEKRERNKPEKNLPAIKTNLKELNRNDDILVWFGHSSYYIQNDGYRILIDPVFEEAAPFAFLNKPFKGTNIYHAEDFPPIDVLIITHDHWDHLDYKTVIKLKNTTGKVVCPLGVGEYFEGWGFKKDQIVELDWNQQANFKSGLTIYCLPSRHFSGRLFKPNQTLWASFMLETTSKNIYISGDGGYDKHFKEIGKQFPRIDISIMENGQYDKNWRFIHLMPEDLLKAIGDLNPYKVFTGHNSRYALSKHSWDEPMNNIADAAEQNSTIPLTMPVIGEVIRLNDATGPVNHWWTDKRN